MVHFEFPKRTQDTTVNYGNRSVVSNQYKTKCKIIFRGVLIKAFEKEHLALQGKTRPSEIACIGKNRKKQYLKFQWIIDKY